MTAQELQNAVGDNWHQVQNYLAQEVAAAVSSAGIVAVAPLQARIAEFSAELAKAKAAADEVLAAARASADLKLAELKASTIPKPETFEEVTRLIATLTESAKALDRRSQAAAAFGELPEQVQQMFGPLFQALSVLPNLADAAKALSAVTVGEEYQPYKDAFVSLLTVKP